MTGDRTAPEERTTETGPDAAASGPAERGVLTRHWDSLDGEAAALLGAVERDLDRVPEGGLLRPAPLCGEGARPRLGGPSLAASAPERPKRWITAVLVAAALTLPFATPAGGPAPKALTGEPVPERPAE
ncbi:DUF3618 domain-containing protein [Methylorubrum aminovorans]